MTEHFTIDEASDLAEDVGLLNCDLNEFEEKLQAFACAAVTAKLKEWEAQTPAGYVNAKSLHLAQTDPDVDMFSFRQAPLKGDVPLYAGPVLTKALPALPADPVNTELAAWVIDPDSIPAEIINTTRDAIRREFGNNGTDGYYKRILAKVFAALSRAQAAPAVGVPDDRVAKNAARFRFAFIESPGWTYGVCKWDGSDWLPINTDADLRELDAAMLASAQPQQKEV